VEKIKNPFTKSKKDDTLKTWFELRIFCNDPKKLFYIIFPIFDNNTFHFFEPHNELRIRTKSTRKDIKNILSKIFDDAIRNGIDLEPIQYGDYDGESGFYGSYWEEFKKIWIEGSLISWGNIANRGDILHLRRDYFLFRRISHCFANQLGLSYFQEGFYHFKMIGRCLYYGMLEKLGKLKT